MPCFPERVMFVQQFRRPVSEISVARTAFAFDFVVIVADDTISTDKDGAIGAKLVKTCPQRRCIGVGYCEALTFIACSGCLDAKARNRVGTQPAYSAIDGRCNRR